MQNDKEVKVVNTLPDKLFTPPPPPFLNVRCLLVNDIHVFFQSS